MYKKKTGRGQENYNVTVEPRYNEGPKDCHIKVLFHIILFYFYWGKENCVLHRGLHYIKVALYHCCWWEPALCVIFKIKLPLITSSVVHWSLLHSGLYGRSFKMESQQRTLKPKQSSKETFPELLTNEQYSIPSFHHKYFYLTPLKWLIFVSLYVGHFISK